jgi:hypothetical protein
MQRTTRNKDQKFREKLKEKRKCQKERAKELIYNYLRNHPCSKCGENKIENLTFHHIDPTTKIATVSSLARSSRSLAKVRREIKKCNVLCRACHDKQHGIKPNIRKRIQKLIDEQGDDSKGNLVLTNHLIDQSLPSGGIIWDLLITTTKTLCIEIPKCIAEIAYRSLIDYISRKIIEGKNRNL